MALDQTFSYSFSLTSRKQTSLTGTFLDLTDMPLRGWNRVILKDSMRSIFPYAEIHFNDLAGLITEHAFFVEGLELTATLSQSKVPTLERLSHDFFWSEFQQLESVTGQGLTGSVIMILSSLFKKKDHGHNFAYAGTINSVINQLLAKKAVEYPFRKRLISTTANQDIWYQDNKYDFEFIGGLADIAQNPSDPFSPFYTFINLKNDFYFATLRDLWQTNPNKIVEEFTILTEPVGETLDPTTVLDYKMMFGGFPVNRQNYNKTFFAVGPSGVTTPAISKIDQHVLRITSSKGSPGVLTVLKQDTLRTTDMVNFGIKNAGEESHYQGWQNHFYRDSALSYRLIIQVPYNSELVSGTIVTLNVKSSKKGKPIASEFSGEWLCTESQVVILNTGSVMTVAELSKSTIDVYPQHPLKSSFV